MTAATGSASLEDRLGALEHRVAMLERMVRLGQELNSSLELDRLLQFIIDAAAELIGAQAASILLMNPNTRELRFEATTGTPRTQLSPLPVPLDGSIAGTVFQQKRPLVIPDVTRDPRWDPRVARTIRFETRSILAVPMRIKDTVVGVLEAVNKLDGAFGESDTQILSILADQAAVALENARLIGELQQAYRELNELDRLKTNVIAIVSHELRTPLALILGYAGFLKEGVSGEAREHADVVLRSAMHLRSLMGNLANLRVLDAEELTVNLEPCDACALVREVAESITPLLGEKGQTLRLELPAGPITVTADADKLGVALANVLDNAMRFSPPGGSIVVGVALHPREAWISVRDSGPGIPDEAFESIFTGFRQVEGPMTRRHGGLGIGLAIARGLVRQQGGRIWAENAPPEGCRFTLAVPAAAGSQTLSPRLDAPRGT